MLLRLLAVLAVGALLAPRAHACSCGGWWRPDSTYCATATRAFGGVVDNYDWPSLFAGGVRVTISVDTVWRGDVPPSMVTYTGYGHGDCGIAVAPGTRLVVCDEQDGDAPPRFGLCNQPVLGPFADELTAALGPGRPPRARGWALPSREALADLVPRGLWALPKALPFAVAGLVALFARRAHRRRPQPVVRPRRAAFAVTLVVVVTGVVILRRTVLASGDWDVLGTWLLAVVGATTLAGAVVAWRGQRNPSRFGSAAAGVAAAGVLVAALEWAGMGRLHLPVQPDGVVACSDARAQALLAQLPARPALSDGYDTWVTEVESRRTAGCADWGLSPIRIVADVSAGPCATYADGSGGRYWRCAGEDTVRYGYEAERLW